jgi:cell division septal protein FtsQ
VTGRPLDQEDINRASASARGINVFNFQTAVVRSRVAALPEVRDVTVTPKLPDRVDVGVLLYVPSIVWHSGGMDYLVTDDGFVVDRGARRDLMRLDDERPVTLMHGDHVSAKTVRGALALQGLLTARQVPVRRYVTLPDDTIRVDGDDSWSVLFSLRGDLVKEADTLVQIEQQHIVFQVLDLRYGSSAFFR